MAKPSISVVDQITLALLWERNRVDEKRMMNVFTEIIVYSSPAGDPNYAGGISNIIKLLTTSGHHVGTIHQIMMPDGTIPHGHPTDYTLRDFSRVRLSAKPKR